MARPDPGANVLFVDIETSPNLGYVWGQWDQNVIEFEKEWILLSVAWCWLGDRETNVVALPDYPALYELDPTNDFMLAALLRDLFDHADVVVAHNGVEFDTKKSQARMVYHGIEPPSPFKEVDTLKVARSKFKFNSNKLGALCAALGLPHKGDPGGFKTWKGCMVGDPKAWATMKKYNKQDVDILEKLYLRFLPWIKNHPNLAVLGERPKACPRCGKVGKMQARGWHVYSVTRRRRFQCQACMGYCSARQTERVESSYVSV
jgi:hypothetical protein